MDYPDHPSSSDHPGSSDPAELADRVTSLARAAVAGYRPHHLPPGLTRDDLEQTAAVEILEQSHRAFLNGKPTEARLLLKAARRAIHAEVERAHRHRGPRGVEDLPTTATPPPEQRAVLGDLLSQLDDEERELIERRYGLGGRPPESRPTLARRLGVSESTVQRRLDQALARMARAADPPEVPGPAPAPPELS